MLYDTNFPGDAIAEDDLRSLVGQLTKLTGQRAEIKRVFVITTDSTDLTTMLDALADSIGDGHSNGHKPQKPKQKKARKAASAGEKKEPTRGPHVRSIKVIETNEMISRFELNKRLDEHRIEPGTQVHSPKYGTLTVVDLGSHMVVIDQNEKVV